MATTSKAYKWLFFILCLLLVEEAIRYSFREGDFVGYVIAGRYAWEGSDLYSHWLNTWPPLFSVFCIPLYFLDRLSPDILRMAWQLLSLLAFWKTGERLMLFFFQKKLVWKTPGNASEINPWNPLFLLPFVLSFKFLLDNLSNIQINVFMLWLCVEAVHFWKKDRPVMAALLLALTLSLKVYTVFFFGLFILLKKGRLVAFTLGWVLLLNLLCLLVYGWDLSLQYYAHWWKEIAQAFPMIHHKNQSFFALVWRFTVDENAGLPLSVNFLDLTMQGSKRIVYLLVLAIGAWPAWRILSKGEKGVNLSAALCLFLALVPLLSPLAWKAYFIFLFPAWIYLSSLFLQRLLTRTEKVLFWTGNALLILSSDLFIGPVASDHAELFSLLTFGAGLLVTVLIMRLGVSSRN